MIDPDIPKTIRFREGDLPELQEIDRQEIERERMEREKEKEENRRWLEEHMGFEPFGDVW